MDNKTDHYLKKAEELMEEGFSQEKALEKALNDTLSLAPLEDYKNILAKEKNVFQLIQAA